MGRRSINTTKSGKYMNPTDQARKEARKRELKKNKKQRQMVRAAVLKGKDPAQILSDMEKIDRMEFSVDQGQPSLNEKVLKEKRKKLKETLDRVLKLYEKEDQEVWLEIKRMMNEYDKRRFLIIQYYESVKTAQTVTVDEIPLPSSAQVPAPVTPQITSPGDIPLPTPKPAAYPVNSILKRTPSIFPVKPRKPPGVPPGPPPELSDNEDSEKEDQGPPGETKSASHETKSERRIRFNDTLSTSEDKTSKFSKRPEELSSKSSFNSHLSQGFAADQNLEEFMKEIESQPKDGGPAGMEHMDMSKMDASQQLNSSNVSMLRMQPILFRPPPLRSGVLPTSGLRIPPGPPPGRPPVLTSGVTNSMTTRMNIRLPPGPPPGVPPLRMVRSLSSSGNVLSAAPQLVQRSKDGPEKVHSGATIQAKPQLRNLSADITKLVPVALRIKREDKKKLKGPSFPETKLDLLSMLKPAHVASFKQTKDDAYAQFMKEMEGLL